MCPHLPSARCPRSVCRPRAPRRPTAGQACKALLCIAMAGFLALAQASVDSVTTFDEVTIESSFGLDLQGAEGVTLLGFDDDFEAPVLDDDRWMVFTQHGSCTLEAGRLRQEITSWSGDSYATVVPRYNFPAAGNFDLEARFDVSGFPNQNAWFAAMRITIQGTIEAEIIRGYNNSQHVWSSQCRFWIGDHWGPWTQQQWTTQGVTSQGWLGFDRPDGQTLRAWYRGSGDWIPYATFSGCAGEASVSLTTNNWVYHAAGFTLWDDFRVNIPSEPYLWAGEAVRTALDTGGPLTINSLSWDATVPDGASLGFQLRTAGDAGGVPGSWSAWFGPDGTPDTWFTVTPSPVTSTPPGARWIQWRLRMESVDGGATPLARSVTTDYGSVPVELASFGAHWTDEGIRLTWVTASEAHNLGFRVLHRVDDELPWSCLSPRMIPARGGSSTPTSYEFLHRDADPRASHAYLLEDIDTEGVATTHGPIVVPPKAPVPTLEPNAPEPFAGGTRWHLRGVTAGFDARIVDLAGRFVAIPTAEPTADGYVLGWDPHTAPGVYALVVTTGGLTLRDVCVKTR